MAYLAPLWAALYFEIGEESTPISLSHHPTEVLHDAWLVFLWMGLSTVMYGVLRHLLTHHVIKGKLYRKSGASHKNDMLMFYAVNISVALLARASHRLAMPSTSLLFPALVVT